MLVVEGKDSLQSSSKAPVAAVPAAGSQLLQPACTTPNIGGKSRPLVLPERLCDNNRGSQSDRCGATAMRLFRSFIRIRQTSYRRHATGTPAHSCPWCFTSGQMT